MRRMLVAGENRWSDFQRNTLNVESVLTYQLDTVRFQVKGSKPNEGDEVIIEDDLLGRLFAGTVVKVELAYTTPDRKINVWQVDCDDYSGQLDSKLVVETYRDVTADTIFKDIVTKYCPGFTVNGVKEGAPVIEQLIFDYKAPSDCFKELCEYIGWHWMVDNFRDLQFFSAEELSKPAPMELHPGGRFRNLKHSIDTQGLRNRVYVRGGTMLSDTFTHEIVADGKARVWTLPHRPHEATMLVSGIPKTVGLENKDKEQDFDYLCNVQEKYIRASSKTGTVPNGTTISWTYRFDIDVITMIEDIESQQKIAAIQNGDGVYEHVITDQSLTTIDAAEAAGMADLREHANPRVKGSFESEVPGWEPGQLVSINLPDRGIKGTFLIQKTTITFDSIHKVWIYRVEYGGRLIGIADVLKALVSAQQKKQINETALLHKFSYGQEKMNVSDEIIFTPRTLGWKCGDPDAICGFVQCG